MDYNNLYKIEIYERFNNLIKSGKNIVDFDNYDLSKIFEYYSCVKLTQELSKLFLLYDVKEIHSMSRCDTINLLQIVNY